ncbi:hypothetical protein RWH45_03670 [Microbacterium sp. KSW4-17]|uniref:Transcription factor zinc-finger domain-containing protein n=1 Tax=Microbacterium galbum TaxID=3075994 RepID=A0ABU3T4R1_9MICO|nr:hypothetical protein [Microbacterium sp. KSW4-17]MDU0366300.1 hypothetical protein [Microbacterium sp. KSW4-17]
MNPSLSDVRRDGDHHGDDDLLDGFPPKCPACASTMKPHSSGDERAWWRCGECALPLIV